MSKNNDQSTKRKKDKKNIKYEPHKKKQKEILKVFHIQMPLLFVYFSLTNKIVCRLSKIPQLMMIIQFNLDYSCF